MTDAVHRHYELYPYPHYPLPASVRRCDGYAINLDALWARFNGELPPNGARRILIAGCGSFSPYPFSCANPDAEIIALDLSERSLARARLHCLLHGRRNVLFRQGDLLDKETENGLFGLIDAYGVLHHMSRPLTGLKTLAAQLADGGILRLMLYSRYARRDEESIRRALRLLKIEDPATVRRLIARAKPGSRLRRFADASSEAGFDAGLADALLHPRVTTYRIDDVMELVRKSGLKPLLFAHNNALDDVGEELERIRRMEADRQSPGNFILYLGRNVRGPCRDGDDPLVLLNPCLTGSVGCLRLLPVRVAPRLGHANPVLGRTQRAFLRRFVRPVRWRSLSVKDMAAVTGYITALFLIQYRPDSTRKALTLHG